MSDHNAPALRARFLHKRLAMLLLAATLAGSLATGVASHAHADDVLAGSKSVRRALLLRESRHEIAGLIGTTLGDAYVRNVLPGARYDYHLFDWLSVGGTLQVGIPVQTETYAEVDVKVTRTNDTFVMEASSLRFLGLAHVSVSPLVGKMMFQGHSPIQFDIHLDLLAGVAGIGSSGEALSTGAGLSLGAGGGIRVFVSNVIALTMGLQALTADRALSVNRDSKESGRGLRFNTVSNFGISFFMPPKMRRGL
jgi:hypothetical protein